MAEELFEFVFAVVAGTADQAAVVAHVVDFHGVERDSGEHTLEVLFVHIDKVRVIMAEHFRLISTVGPFPGTHVLFAYITEPVTCVLRKLCGIRVFMQQHTVPVRIMHQINILRFGTHDQIAAVVIHEPDPIFVQFVAYIFKISIEPFKIIGKIKAHMEAKIDCQIDPSILKKTPAS